MREEVPTALLVAEKLFGIILIIIGAFITYITAIAPPTGDAGIFSSIFIIVGIVILGIGILLLIAKNE
jgi:uncharacterized membrane protein YczE